MPEFRTWIRNKTVSAHDSSNCLEVSEPALPPGLLVLPPQRQRVLTPSSSRENIIQNIPPQKRLLPASAARPAAPDIHCRLWGAHGPHGPAIRLS